MKTYSTYSGAYRAAHGKPILRLLDDPRQAFVVLPSEDTRLMAVSGCKGLTDGTLSYEDLKLGGKVS